MEEALRSGARPLRRLVVVQTGRQFSELVELARKAGVPVRIEPRQALDRLVPSGRHQGIVALAGAKAYVEPDEMLRAARDRNQPALVLLLDGVEDPHNLGAILRTAYCAGADGVVLPERRAAGITPVVEKASAGASEHLSVARVTNMNRALERLKEAGVWLVGLDERATQSFTEVDLTGPTGLVLGGEGKGLHEQVRAKCDFLVGIPTAGAIRSLNVSVAAGVVLYEAVRQRRAKGGATK